MAQQGEWIKRKHNDQEVYVQENDGFTLVVEPALETAAKTTAKISKLIAGIVSETETGELMELSLGKMFLPNSYEHFKTNIFIPTNVPHKALEFTPSNSSSLCCDYCALNPTFDIESQRTLFSSPIQEYFDLFYDNDDAIIIHQKQIEPTLFNLQTTVDLWLEAYFYLQVDLFSIPLLLAYTTIM